MTLFTGFFVALLLSMILVPPLMRYSRRLGLVDIADERKIHAGVIPRSGGIAIVIGALVPMLIWGPDDRLVHGLMLGAAIIFVFGVLDDRNGLHFAWKFFGQFLAVAVVMAAGLRIEVLPFLGIDPVSAIISIPLTALFLVGVTNAINLSDGLDGLAAGTSLIALAAIAWLFYQSQAMGMALLALAMLGGICGFLRYNNHPAVIFMGDTGSQFLGFVTAVLAVILTQQTNPALNPALLLLLLGLPILDTLTVMAWRLRTGRSPFLPDRNHFHHRLLDFGFYHYEAVSVIYVVQAVLVTIAVLVRFEGDLAVVGTYALFSAVVLAGFRYARLRGLRVRTDADAPRQERRSATRRRFPWVATLAVRGTELLAAAFLLFAAFYPTQVDKQFAIGCAVLALGTVLSRMLPSALGNFASRLSVYLAGVCAVLALLGESRFTAITAWHIDLYMLALGAFLIVAIRLTRREQFRTTPLDLLVMFFVLTLVVASVLSSDTVDRTYLADTAIRLAVFFYTSEYICSREQGSHLALPAAAVASLSILAARGLA